MIIEQPPGNAALPFEPKPEFRHLAADAALADCRGKRIGVLVVTYNAVTTLKSVLKRIPPVVWDNVEEVVVLDDASQDATFDLAIGIKSVLSLPSAEIWATAATRKLATAISLRRASIFAYYSMAMASMRRRCWPKCTRHW